MDAAHEHKSINKKRFYCFACFRHGGISLICTGLELYVHSETNSMSLWQYCLVLFFYI